MTDYRKLFDLTGKTAVVLGAASGIGKSSAEALAALGAGVLCADKSVEGAQATAAAIREDGGVADAAACDAASAADVAALAGIAKQKFPRLDIAVTTPGLAWCTPLNTPVKLTEPNWANISMIASDSPQSPTRLAMKAFLAATGGAGL